MDDVPVSKPRKLGEFPTDPPKVTITMFLWTLVPMFLAIFGMLIAVLLVISSQNDRAKLRDTQLCYLAHGIQLFEVFMPPQFKHYFDEFISSVASHESDCGPAIIPPNHIEPLPISPTPQPTVTKHGPKVRITVTETPGQPARTTITVLPTHKPVGRTPRGKNSSSPTPSPTPPKKHKHKPPKKKPQSIATTICSVEQIALGRCMIKWPTP